MVGGSYVMFKFIKKIFKRKKKSKKQNGVPTSIKEVIEHDEERIRVRGSCLIGIPPKNKV